MARLARAKNPFRSHRTARAGIGRTWESGASKAMGPGNERAAKRPLPGGHRGDDGRGNNGFLTRSHTYRRDPPRAALSRALRIHSA